MLGEFGRECCFSAANISADGDMLKFFPHREWLALRR
jgi:hypothetical protein